jgi:hypothetical protein
MKKKYLKTEQATPYPFLAVHGTNSLLPFD